MQNLLELDKQLFLIINHLPHNFFLDTFFGFVTFIGYFGVAWLAIAFILILKNKKKAKNLLAMIISVELLYIFLVEAILKNWIGRLRPQFSIAGIIMPYDFSRSFSFPSGHTTIAFAAAFVLGRENKKLKWFYWTLAALIAFSRVYLGKHYPSDVAAGAAIGIFLGIFSIKLVKNRRLR